MRNLLLFTLLFTTLTAYSRQADTSAYQTQRLKVNALLNQRSAKFGQYDQSLNAKTGIFGIQTKSDVKKSNEILRQIVINDNTIFKELKILMDYKDLEVRQAKDKVTEANLQVQNYRDTIKKLQANESDSNNPVSSKGLGKAANYIIILLIVSLISMYIYFKKQLSSTKKTTL